MHQASIDRPLRKKQVWELKQPMRMSTGGRIVPIKEGERYPGWLVEDHVRTDLVPLKNLNGESRNFNDAFNDNEYGKCR